MPADARRPGACIAVGPADLISVPHALGPADEPGRTGNRPAGLAVRDLAGPGSDGSGRGQVLEQPVPHGQRGRLQPGMDTKLGQQRLDVRAHGGG